ncbi:hypothetical protein [Gemella cuniculi]|uniref:hypothetical protein n=1 Tax=Gemella cuniculi TaxID=150240 RepID=UPI00040A7CBC|nr:hypothetical protein [Gemella cuniculi]
MKKGTKKNLLIISLIVIICLVALAFITQNYILVIITFAILSLSSIPTYYSRKKMVDKKMHNYLLAEAVTLTLGYFSIGISHAGNIYYSNNGETTTELKILFSTLPLIFFILYLIILYLGRRKIKEIES